MRWWRRQEREPVGADLTAVRQLDEALDQVAGGRQPPPDGEASELARVAALWRDSVPPSPASAPEQGRAALLARAERLARSRPRRRLVVVAVALLAALLVGVPAALAGDAVPGTPLWPLREAGHNARVAFADNQVGRASLQLDMAEGLLAKAAAQRGHRADMLAEARQRVDAALAELRGQTGEAADAARDRADDVLDGIEDLAEDGELDDDDRRGPDAGEDADGADDNSGKGGDDPVEDPTDDHGGSGSGSDDGSDDSRTRTRHRNGSGSGED